MCVCKVLLVMKEDWKWATELLYIVLHGPCTELTVYILLQATEIHLSPPYMHVGAQTASQVGFVGNPPLQQSDAAASKCDSFIHNQHLTAHRLLNNAKIMYMLCNKSIYNVLYLSLFNS